MFRYTVQLFGLTIFALTLIWFAGPGDASQSSTVLWADTSHIDVDNTESVNAREKKARQNQDSFLRNVKKLTQTAFNIRNNYMEDVDTDEMIKAGITGMLSDLDRFSVLMEKQSYDALMESTHGKYQGLGMQIDSRDDRIVIIAPIEGTPAHKRGLKAGDVIFEIDGTTTEGMKTSDAAKLMRGEAGTGVTLLIRRQGIAEDIEFYIERAVIELHSVNYSGLVPGTDIGYIRLSRFAEETTHELRKALSDLNEKNVSALILDLRSNGGGLLDQAKQTAELFIKEGAEIVYTKGRENSSERHYRSERPPLLPEDKRLVVLVDEGTASASEIVAGAIQDWDRGLIIGNPTYGKGLVQQIFPVSNDGSVALKLTTARYYVPSGRCIQRPEREGKIGVKHNISKSDNDGEEDTLTVDDREIFYTNGGRIVYGGGGIVPDVNVERETFKTIEINLERQSIFFDFAVTYVADNPDVRPTFEVNDEIISTFSKFLKKNDFEYKTALQASLERLKETVSDEGREETFNDAIESLENLIEDEKNNDFEKSLAYIKRAIKREIVRSIAGERGVYENSILKTDKTIKEAVRILSTPKEYSRLINEGKKKAEL